MWRLVFILLITVSCCSSPSQEYGQSVHKNMGVDFSNFLSPIYVVDKIDPGDPVVLLYSDHSMFITQKKFLKEYTVREQFVNRQDVYSYLTGSDWGYKLGGFYNIFDLSEQEDNPVFLLEKNYFPTEYYLLEMDEEADDFMVFSFKIKPDYFLLTLIATEEFVYPAPIPGVMGNLANDVIERVGFSRQYYPALYPVFTEKELKILQKEYPGWDKAEREIIMDRIQSFMRK